MRQPASWFIACFGCAYRLHTCGISPRACVATLPPRHSLALIKGGWECELEGVRNFPQWGNVTPKQGSCNPLQGACDP